MDAPITIDLSKCRGCTKCVSGCPFGALSMTDAPEKRDRKAQLSGDCRACGACIRNCPFGAIAETQKKGTRGTPDKETYHDIWVFAEQRGGTVQEVAFELLTQGRKLALDRGCSLGAVLLGHQVTPLAQELIAAGADKVYIVDQPQLADYDADAYTDALAELIRRHKPEIVLAGATAIGRSFFAKVAVRSKTGLTADCTALEIDPESKLLWQTRPAFGGNIMATIMCPDHRPQMATVRPKVFRKTPPDTSRKGEILEEVLNQITARTKLLKTQHAADGLDISAAEIIVSGGRGLGKAENFSLVRELADLLGGVVGSSRACVDAGWIGASHQVGQTGKTVCPKLYLALGISGAIQHTAGMANSDCIIAVNKDPDAPIFQVADLGIVGDLQIIVPQLIAALKAKAKEGK